MQPYFFPYIGYFQLIAAADLFIVYDNIKYTKKGWINRNRILRNGKDVIISLPLKKDPDSCDVRERQLAPEFNPAKLLNRIAEAYRGAPYINQTLALASETLQFKSNNLFTFLHNSIARTCSHLGIETKIVISSDVSVDHDLRSQERVVAICKATGAKTYINLIGGVELYSRDAFLKTGIDLKFLRTKFIEYEQFGGNFVPSLSIIDVLMFNSLGTTREWLLASYELI